MKSQSADATQSLPVHFDDGIEAPSEAVSEAVSGGRQPGAARSGEDTIVAVSTATGPGAIGIVRMSGWGAIEIARRAFQPARGRALDSAETYRLLYGRVTDPDNGETVDEALLAVMRSPGSYTREDVVEFQCHGGLAAQRAVLRLMVRLGARLAEPGEFTRRAFLNGRIDLAQAESVAAVVSARSSGALRASMRQLEGGLSDRLRSARRALLRVLAQIEVTVDFADEDVDPLDWGALGKDLVAIRDQLGELLRTAFLGRALEHGVRTAIVGKPNVGKSSLLNALIMRERSIVSEIPGTTRDTVEEFVEIGGIPIHLVDTAGMRASVDRVEQLGVERSVRAMEQADLVLAVLDLSVKSDSGEAKLLAGLDPCRSIVIGNKSDLVPATLAEMRRKHLAVVDAVNIKGVERSERRWCVVSAVTGDGIDELRTCIQDVVTCGQGLPVEEPVLATERQRSLVGDALDSTEAAVVGIDHGGNEELVCEDVRRAVYALGRITGEDFTPDLLDEIFSRFCLGK